MLPEVVRWPSASVWLASTVWCTEKALILMVGEVKGRGTWEWQLDQPNGSIYHTAGADFLVWQHTGERFPNWDFCFPLKLEISLSAKRVMEHVRVVNVGNALFAELETLGTDERQWLISSEQHPRFNWDSRSWIQATPLEEGEAVQRLLGMCPRDSGNAVHHCMVHLMHIKWSDHLITFIWSCFYEIHTVFFWKKFLFILHVLGMSPIEYIVML